LHNFGRLRACRRHALLSALIRVPAARAATAKWDATLGELRLNRLKLRVEGALDFSTATAQPSP